MFTKPSSRALRALYSLSNHVAWDDVDKMFADELSSLHEQLAQALDEVTLRRLQGRVQFLTEFLKLVREAPQLLEKMRESSL